MSACGRTIVCGACKVELSIPPNTTATKGRCVCGEMLSLLQPSIAAARSRNPANVEFAAPSNTISFTLNGKPVSAVIEDTAITLNEYLRSYTHSSEVKRMCAEAGCGVCTVTLGYVDPVTKIPKSIAINSCVRPLASIDGMTVTTSKGVGTQRDGFHPVQLAIADGNGSQCGACTPGMVMSMYSLLLEKEKPTRAEIERHFDGNICRCTGYMPILKAFQDFAVDRPSSTAKAPAQAAAEMLQGLQHAVAGVTCHHGKHTPPVAAVASLERARALKPLPVPAGPRALNLKGVAAGPAWFRPVTMADLYSVLDANAGKSVKIVVGNTSVGVFKEDHFDVNVDVLGIPDLHAVKDLEDGVRVGAAVSLNSLLNILEAHKEKSASFAHMIRHLTKVANTMVRNIGSWAGNLVLVNKHEFFPSDVFTVLMGAGATLRIGTAPDASSSMSLDDFLTYDMPPTAVILSVDIPYQHIGEVYRSYKVMPRAVNAHAVINAAFSMRIESSKITRPCFVFGGVTARHVRAKQTEQFVQGKSPFDAAMVTEALDILQKELTPQPHPGQMSVDFRKTLIPALLYKFFLTVQLSLPADLRSTIVPFDRPPSTSVESYQTDPNEYPVSEAVPKLGARIQASGEAVYADDVPLRADGACGAFVTATVGCGKLASVDVSEALAYPGVIGYLSAADIPGQNLFSDEEIFASTDIAYYGQAIGMILAKHQYQADHAATLVKSTYTDIKKPILTIEDAIAAKSTFPNPFPPLVQGDVDKALAQSDMVLEGEVEMPAQYHFTMEPQTACAFPGEGDTMEVVSSTQWPALTQSTVAAALNRPVNAITVSTKRVGGAFGGKIERNNQVAAAVAVAAHVHDRPVRSQLTLNTNMAMVGKRVPMKAVYKIGVNKDGTITAVQYDVYCDAGHTANMGASNYFALSVAVDNCYKIANWKVTGHVVRTNLPTNTAMRAPGMLPAAFFIDYMVDHAATAVGMAPETLREKLFYNKHDVTPYGQPLPYFDMPLIWADLKAASQFDARKKEIDTFNVANKWVKRGIAMVPVKYGVAWGGAQYGVSVNIIAADGSVQLTVGGVEIGQGVFTKAAQVAAREIGVPLSAIKVLDTSTSLGGNSDATGGSVTSDLCCVAVLEACAKLMGPIAAFRKTLPADTPWKEVVSKAREANVPLCVSHITAGKAPKAGVFTYSSNGAACSEVRLDVLTGEIEIIRTDILFDLGTSLNPAVDIGQVQGGFIMSMGYMMAEQLLFSPENGRLLSDGTWDYKPPTAFDIPVDMRVSLLKNAPNPDGVLSSKASGEPPCALAGAVFFATKYACAAARTQAGQPGPFALGVPCTIEERNKACLVRPSQFNESG